MLDERSLGVRATTPWARATLQGRPAIFSARSDGVRYAIDRFYYLHHGDGLFESRDGASWSRIPLPGVSFVTFDIVSKRAAWPDDREIILATTDGVFVVNGDGSRAGQISGQAASTVLGFRDFAPAFEHERPLQVVIGFARGRLLRWIEGGTWTQIHPLIGDEPPVRMTKVRAVADDWAHPGTAFLTCAYPSTNYRVFSSLWRLDLVNGAAPSRCPLPDEDCTSMGSSGAFLFLGGSTNVFTCDMNQPSLRWIALSRPAPPVGSDGVPATRRPASLGWDAPNLYCGFEGEGICIASPGWGHGFTWLAVAEGFPRVAGYEALPPGDPCHFRTAKHLAVGVDRMVAVIGSPAGDELWWTAEAAM